MMSCWTDCLPPVEQPAAIDRAERGVTRAGDDWSPACSVRPAVAINKFRCATGRESGVSGCLMAVLSH
jgi:hypothetical protein